MVRYPVVLEPDDNGTVMVAFPDFPEAQTFGEDEADALARASDALATIVDGYIRTRRPLPAPSPLSGLAAELSALMSAKVELYKVRTCPIRLITINQATTATKRTRTAIGFRSTGFTTPSNRTR